MYSRKNRTNDHAILAKVDQFTDSELNDPDESGRNALMMIAQSREGRQMIDENDALRKKITATGFSLFDDRGESVENYFLRWTDGQKILLRRADLRAKLTAECLNRRRDFSSMPNVFELAKTEDGIALLLDPTVRDLITEEGLNAAIMHRSAAFLLSSKVSGLALFADEVLRDKIKTKTLNAREDHSGCSVVVNLCKSEQGQEFLAADKKLVNKISADTFNARQRDGTSALFHLTRSPIGLKILATSRHLRGLINIDSMNAACASGPERGTSPLLWLLACAEGREILIHDRRLRSLIEPRDLRANFLKEDGCGLSAADYLTLPESENLLRLLNPELREVVNAARERNASDVKLMWNISGTLFAPQKKSPQLPEEMVEESRCVIA